MGSFYSSDIVWHRDVEAVLAAIGDRRALVGPLDDGLVVVFPDQEDPRTDLTGAVATALGCRVLSCDVHDSDVLTCSVWSDGILRVAFSVPDVQEYFGLDDETMAALELEFDPSDLGSVLDPLAGDAVDPADGFESGLGSPPDPQPTAGGGSGSGSGLAGVDALIKALALPVEQHRAVRQVFSTDYVLAEERHCDFLRAAGLPTAPGNWGYRYLKQDGADYAGPSLIETPRQR